MFLKKFLKRKTHKYFFQVFNMFENYQFICEDRLFMYLNREKYFYQKISKKLFNKIMHEMILENLIVLTNHGQVYSLTKHENMIGKEVTINGTKGHIVFQDNHRLFINCQVNGSTVQIAAYSFEVTHGK